jgi:hypothetical protein
MEEVLGWVRSDWKNNRLLFINELVSCVTAVASSIYLSLSAPNTSFSLIFTLYTINSLSGIICSYYRKSMIILLTNTFYLVMNIIGLRKV